MTPDIVTPRAASAATETDAALRLLRFVRLMRLNIERDVFIDPIKRAMYVGMIDVAIAEFVIASASKTSGCESPQGPPETSTTEVKARQGTRGNNPCVPQNTSIQPSHLICRINGRIDTGFYPSCVSARFSELFTLRARHSFLP